jgi:hypothetical protein
MWWTEFDYLSGMVLVGVAHYNWILFGEPGFSSWKELGSVHQYTDEYWQVFCWE